MDKLNPENPNIQKRGKTIRQIIKELESFEDQEMEVKVSIDCGVTGFSIGLVGRLNSCCVLMNCED